MPFWLSFSCVFCSSEITGAAVGVCLETSCRFHLVICYFEHLQQSTFALWASAGNYTSQCQLDHFLIWGRCCLSFWSSKSKVVSCQPSNNYSLLFLTSHLVLNFRVLLALLPSSDWEQWVTWFERRYLAWTEAEDLSATQFEWASQKESELIQRCRFYCLKKDWQQISFRRANKLLFLSLAGSTCS